jgi:hypothetical protein
MAGMIDALKTKWRAWRAPAEPTLAGAEPAPSQDGGVKRLFRRTGLGVSAFVLVLLLYYGLGGLLLSKVDADASFRPGAADLPANGSVAVGMASGLMDREVNVNGWVPNNPWFFPTGWIDNMPNFQRGVVEIVRQFSLEMRDQVGRLRGTGGTDPDLEAAFTSLSQSADLWWLNAHRPIFSTSAESRYRDGVAALRRYNLRVASGKAVFERRQDTLAATLDRLALSLGAASNALNQHATAYSSDLVDFGGDDVFYQAKGQAYASYMLLAGLRQDYDGLIRNRELAALWAQLMESLKQATELDPLVVQNNAADGLMPNHLLALDSTMQTARARLREITSILAR